MAIPMDQLQRWTNQPSTATASSTYNSIRTALKANQSRIKGKSVDIYLQGSYRNDTNIRGDSDIDVVVQLNDVFIYDTSCLTLQESQLFSRTISKAAYTWENFRSDVLATLEAYYGKNAVTTGNKSIKVAKKDGRLAADVIPCLQYRSYRQYSTARQTYVEGICFWTEKEHRMVVNYPKQHYENGTNKNTLNASGGLFKPAVRLVKNARAHLYQQGIITKDLSPSYFVECLMFNLPHTVFDCRLDHMFCNILNHLNAQSNAQLNEYMCQNGQVMLFGSSQEQWDITRARRLNAELIRLWSGWKG